MTLADRDNRIATELMINSRRLKCGSGDDDTVDVDDEDVGGGTTNDS